MNLLLFRAAELVAPDLAVVALNRYPARTDWWPPPIGRVLRVGVCDHALGSGRVEAVDKGCAYVRFTLDAPPPPPLPLTVVLALPRPKMLRRVLRTTAELGIKRLVLVNATRVEKSYWQSPLLASEALWHSLREGLEQCCDCIVPQVSLRPRLKPFVEDELPGMSAGTRALIAHPAAPTACPAAGAGTPATLAIGPEGGFSDYELNLFATAGFRPFSLGPRILRVETALPVLGTTLFPCTAPSD